MACSLEYDAHHRVLRARFEGTLTRSDLESMIVRVGAFAARHAACDGIMDFSDVQSLALDEGYLRELGRGRRIKSLIGVRRVLVAPTPETQRLARLYAQQQERAGHSVEIVMSSAEACQRLGLATSDFRPLGEATAPKAAS